MSEPSVPSRRPTQGLELIEVSPSAWRRTCREELDEGARFCGAYAAGSGGNQRWSALFATGATTRILATREEGAPLPTIVDLVPAADWDEREAHDLHELSFDDREPIRALVAHPAETEAWTVPVQGEGTYDVAVGPIHAGVIESGHFRFHVIGERILLLDPQLFYKHRGLERAAEGRRLEDGLAFAQRSCGACAVANSVAYAQACEGTLGLIATRSMRRARTFLLELERLYNHLNDIATICAGVGFALGNMSFASFKERAMRLNRELAGHRFLFGTIGLGVSQLMLSSSQVDRAAGILRELREDASRAWRELRFAASVQARLGGVGVLSRDDAIALGAVGPAARASGVRIDARDANPGLWYESAFTPATPSVATGDVAARLELRGIELAVTFELLEDLLSEPIPTAVAQTAAAAAPLGAARVESPRGETVCVVEVESGRLRRLHLRTGSYANWPALASATAGNLLPDFPLINKSFELCYACVDR